MTRDWKAVAAPHVLREYALLADGERGALIGPNGDVQWLCAPRWHDNAVFSTLIGGKGAYCIAPRDRHVWGGFYEDGGLIWRSRWIVGDNIVECREALAFPGDPSRVVFLRQVRAVRGEARVRLVFAPAADFGRDGLRHVARDDRGCWHGFVGDLKVRLSGVPYAVLGHQDGIAGLTADIDVKEDKRHDVVLEMSRAPSSHPVPDAVALWSATERAWRGELPAFSQSVAARDARHAYGVLRGLTSANGGMVAAATMSLPERAEQGRNYDYRYVWIRDQCYAGQAVSVDGAHRILDDAVAFVGQRLVDDGEHLKPAYTVDGDPVPEERSLRLPGYPGGTDIKGNHVNSQFQLDAFGEALLLFAAAARRDHLDGQACRAVDVAVAAIAESWQHADAGIWELQQHRWTHSRLICVAGLRAIAPCAPTRVAESCLSLAEAITADLADSVHPTGRWQRAPDDSRVDAALLAASIRGAVPAGDPRSRATLQAVTNELTDDGFVYRFRHDRRPLRDAEGAFLLCGFWMALAAHQLGDEVSAFRYFERNRAACGPPGLFCEEYDVAQRQLRGNLPQAFVHALLIETSLRLSQPWKPECLSMP